MISQASTALDEDAVASLAERALEKGEEAQAIPIVRGAAERLCANYQPAVALQLTALESQEPCSGRGHRGQPHRRAFV